VRRRRAEAMQCQSEAASTRRSGNASSNYRGRGPRRGISMGCGRA
jgi:hypothetical protein